jgi:hypothetical protein
MKFFSLMLVVLSASILSGFFVLSGIPDSFGIGYWYCLLLSGILTVLGFWWRFGTYSRLKIRIHRSYIYLNSIFSKIEQRINFPDEEKNITELQEKGIRLWKLCLRDPETTITCSISNQIRQIEKENMVIILNPISSVDYMMTIMDVDSTKSCLYEIRIGQKLSEGVISSFDIENERRIKMGEEERRKSIFMDLDKLLLQEEESVRKLKTS